MRTRPLPRHPGPCLASLAATIVLLVDAPQAVFGAATPAPAPDTDGWYSLFNGRSLDGWRANEKPGTFEVVDGAIVAHGFRSHLFYEGPVANADFRNFEFAAEVLARPAANSGVYFHTAYQQEGWPGKGYEVQVNNTASGEGGYYENKKTGSLYGVRNVHKQLVPNDQWFTLRIAVRGRHVTIHVNDIQTVDYVAPEGSATGGFRDRRLDHGTFALQGHDPGSEVRYRNLRVKPLPDDAADPLDPQAWVIARGLARLHSGNYPVIDLHTHLKGGLTLDDVVQRQFHTGINAGIAVNGGLGFPVTNDAALDRALASIRHPLTFTALQAEGREWLTLFSREAIARFDYVFTDAMTIFNEQGKRMRLWIPGEVEIGEPEAFMDMLVHRTVAILENEPIDLWVNPTYLPAPLDARYAELWTEPRMRRVIDAAVRHGVAIEINDRFQLPKIPFLRLAKEAGARFTFGTNNGGKDDLGRLDYCAQAVRECNLQWQDFWMPGREPNRAQRSR